MKNYVVTQDFKTPYVVSTGMPHKPTQILFKKFKKGEIVKGELKYANGKPAFVLYKGTVVMPFSAVKEVVTKELVFSADGEGDKKKLDITKKVIDPKIMYLDAILLGAVVGAVGMHFAEKKEWVAPVEGSAYQNKLIGATIGSALFAYALFRYKKGQNVGVAKTVKQE